MDSNGSKSKLSGLPRIHPRVTMNGITKRAICCARIPKSCQINGLRGVRGTGRTILEPTATPSDSVSLSLTDTVTAVTCSGRRKKREGKCHQSG